MTGGPAEPRKYRQLAGLQRAQITEGTLVSGRPVPSITALAGQYGYARQTCAKVRRMLQDEGPLTRVPGLGYYAAVSPGTPRG